MSWMKVNNNRKKKQWKAKLFKNKNWADDNAAYLTNEHTEGIKLNIKLK